MDKINHLSALKKVSRSSGQITKYNLCVAYGYLINSVSCKMALNVFSIKLHVSDQCGPTGSKKITIHRVLIYMRPVY